MQIKMLMATAVDTILHHQATYSSVATISGNQQWRPNIHSFRTTFQKDANETGARLKHMLVQVDEYNYLNNTLSQKERKTTLCINSVPTHKHIVF